MLSGNSNKKDLNFELNLMPVFDILSVCICFLLMTVVWIQVGSMKTSQALGGQSQNETKNPPSIWLTVDDKANVTLSYKNTKQKYGDQVIKNENGQVNWTNLLTKIDTVSKSSAGFQTAIIMPAKKSSYDDVIHYMDAFRSAGMTDVGIAPL
jgi:biopolymer transport protein TolR